MAPLSRKILLITRHSGTQMLLLSVIWCFRLPWIFRGLLKKYYLRHIMERTEIVEIMMTILHMCMYAVWTGEVVYATGCHCLQT